MNTEYIHSNIYWATTTMCQALYQAFCQELSLPRAEVQLWIHMYYKTEIKPILQLKTEQCLCNGCQ